MDFQTHPVIVYHNCIICIDMHRSCHNSLTGFLTLELEPLQLEGKWKLLKLVSSCHDCKWMSGGISGGVAEI